MKAILVIEMPKNCDKCGIRCKYYYSAYKNSTTKSIKPDSCPLKQMPSKRSTEYNPARNPYITQGYNACIDEILGDKE